MGYKVDRLALKGIMASKGVDQRDLAEKTGYNESQISRFFNGSTPSYRFIVQVRRVLSLSNEQVAQVFFADNLAKNA